MRLEPTGIVAIAVSFAPKLKLNLALVFTAQPLASSNGAKLRARNLNQANSIEGPDTNNTIPKSANGICHHTRPKKLVTTEASAVPMAPIAKPMVQVLQLLALVFQQFWLHHQLLLHFLLQDLYLLLQQIFGFGRKSSDRYVGTA